MSAQLVIDDLQSRDEAATRAGQLSVRLMTATDIPRWDAFVVHCPHATFFHRAGWQRVIEHAFAHRTYFFLAEADGQIEGVLPLAEIKHFLFGHSLSSLPFCVYGGVAATTERARVALTSEAVELARRLGVDHLEYRSQDQSQSDWLTKDLYVTFRRTLDPDLDKNMAAIPRKQRAMVRKGIKNGLTSEIDDGTERFFPVYAESVHRLGTPVFPRRYFDILADVFQKDLQILTVTHDGRLVASVMSFFFRDQVLPYYGGGTRLARELAGNDFMYWEVMRLAHDRGVRVFDFGRSKRGTGSFDFKKNWGFEPEPLRYEYRMVQGRTVPDHNPLNPKYRLFISLWKRLPRSIADHLGQYIVKYVG